MPIFKVSITRTREETCDVLVRMPDKDYLNTNTEDSLAVLEYADEEGTWDEAADDQYMRVRAATEKEINAEQVSIHCIFGGTEYEMEEKPKTGPPVDPRQMALKITP